MATDVRSAGGSEHVVAGGRSFRPAIQGLRAIAVGLVVLFHLWPARVTGGYVGVDVFFVISGFLITAHMVREVDTTGGLRVLPFWARRIRRLLPASLLVLALITLVLLARGPSTITLTSLRQIAASALYVQNWVLAFDAVDYMSVATPPTVAQHYWSLSVEEQFYAGWPLLVLLAIGLHTAFFRGRPPEASRNGRRRSVATLLGLLAASSFAWSVVSTSRDQAFAYFSTFTRAWEFAAGALLALVTVALPRRAAVAAGWVGVAAMLGSGLVLTPDSAFPGWVAALPVLGATLALAGHDGGPSTAGWWLSRRPLVWLGDISYSIYLIHWPLIVMAPWFTGHPLRGWEKVVVAGATLALGWLSKTFVEDPVRRGQVLGGQTWRAIGFAVVCTGLLAGSALALRSDIIARHNAILERAERPETAGGHGDADAGPSPFEDRPCHGPNALLASAGCASVPGNGPLALPPALTAVGAKKGYFERCLQDNDAAELTTCRLGDTDRPTAKWALLGDSHAIALAPALDFAGRAQHWEIVAHAKGACPNTVAHRVLKSDPPGRAATCDAFNEKARAAVLADDRITDVVVVQRLHAYTFVARGDQPLEVPSRDGFTTLWRDLARAGKRVHVVSETPSMRTPAPACLEANAANPLACAIPRAKLPVDPVPGWVADLADPDISVLDLTPAFCDSQWCHARIGDVTVYQDTNHLSYEYARLLAPYVAHLLEAPRSP